MNRIQVFFEDGEYSVWLDTELGERDGVCLAVSKYRKTAIKDAIKHLHASLDSLNDNIKVSEERKILRKIARKFHSRINNTTQHRTLE